MNVLFLTVSNINNVYKQTIYADLMRQFNANGHAVYIVSPTERRNGEKTRLKTQDNINILKVKIGNITKTNIIEKGISTLLISFDFERAINKYLKGIKFDLILYSTPPITLAPLVKKLKAKHKALTYLMLKDIFPQNAVDLNMFSKRSIFYKYFRYKEKKLYQMSDYIGCMSPKNAEYLKEHNKIDENKIEVCPNSLEDTELDIGYDLDKIKEKYGLPKDKTIFLYGGNLGRPQDIDFIIECLKVVSTIEEAYFFIAGSGTEYEKLNDYCLSTGQKNVKLIPHIPENEYMYTVMACDVGLIFLDYRFTIPNFPSRMLSYMQARLPMVSMTDPNTDLPDIIKDNDLGYCAFSNNSKDFYDIVKKCIDDKESLVRMGKNSRDFYLKNYTVDKTYEIIVKHFERVV